MEASVDGMSLDDTRRIQPADVKHPRREPPGEIAFACEEPVSRDERDIHPFVPQLDDVKRTGLVQDKVETPVGNVNEPKQYHFLLL